MKQRYFILAFLHAVGFSFLSLSANPTGGDVVGGSATIQTAPTTVTIQQQSQAAVINWQSFSIDSGELTKFIQPNSSAAVLNRVLGGSTSYLNGTLSANGQVYLINGNGIVIGQSGLVNTAGFIASTRDIANNDFLSGNLHFTGSSNAGVQNLGTVKALGGDVYFIGQTVDNEGTINADGHVGLAAGNDVLITQSGSEHVFIQPLANSGANGSLTGVTNAGSIAASTAELKAANGNIYALAINNTGSIRATGVQHQGGHIYLTSDTGTIQNSGTLNASATAVSGNGGTIKLKTGGALITTSTSQILAQGGAGGHGGQIETSGETAQLDGVIYAGAGGSWLIDPQDVDITATLAGIINADLASNSSVTIDTTGTTATGTPTDVNGGLGATTGSGNITVDSALTFASTTTAGTSLTLNAAGAIVVNQGITTASGGSGSVQLNSDSSITLDAPITLNATSGILTLTLNSSGTVTQGTSGAITAHGLLLDGSLGSGQYLLTNSGNGVSILAANGGSASGGISYTNNGSFMVGTVGSISGVSAPTANVTLKTPTGTLTVNDTITSGSGTATLDAPTIDLNAYVVGNVAGTANVATVNLGPAIGTSENLVDDTYITEGVTLLASSTATTPTLNLNSTSTYYLGNPVNIASDLTLEGNGATLDGANGTALIGVTGGTVVLDQMTLQNASNTDFGGSALYVTGGTVTLENSTVQNNSSNGQGGAIYNDATLTLLSDTITGNTATGIGSQGGGIYNDSDGTLTVTAGSITGNSADQGGGIYNVGTLTTTDNQIKNNTVTLSGGGIYNTGSMTLNDPTIKGNSGATDNSNGIYSETATGTFQINGDSGVDSGYAITLDDDILIKAGALTIDTDSADSTHGTASVTLNGLIDSVGAVTIYGETITANNSVKGSSLTLASDSAGTVTLNNSAYFTATDTTGNSIQITTGTFTNNSTSSTPLSESGTAYGDIYNLNTATDPSTATLGNLAPDYVQVGYTGTLSGTGNGLIYAFTPSVATVSLGGTTTKTYDGTMNVTDASGLTLTGTGPYSGDTLTLNTPVLTDYSYASSDAVNNTAVAHGNVSVANVSLLSATSTLGGQLSTAVPIYGYTLASSTVTGAVGVITPETITGSVATQTLTYGTAPDLTSTGIFISTGTLYGSDSLSLTTTDGLSTGGYYNATESSNLTVALNSTNPNASGDYVLSIPDGTLVMNQKVIDPTIVGTVSKTYDTTSSATLTSGNYGLIGTESGDNVSLVGATGANSGTYSTTTSATASVAGANADTTGALLPAASHYYVVANTGETPLSLSGADAGNYVLSSTANASGQVGIIKQYAVPVTINAQGITYGQDGNINLVYTEGVTGSTTATSLPDEGLTASDLIQNLAVFQTSTSTLATQNTFSHYNAGSYDLGVIGKGNSNYALEVTPGTLSVSQAVLTYVPDPAGAKANTSVYGFTPVTPTGTVTGFATGESAGNFAGSGTAVFTTSPTLVYNTGAGSYPITGSGLSSSNYTFSQAGGSYVVTQAPLIVSLDPSLIQVNQGQSVPFLNVVYSGFISGDNFNAVFGEQTLNISTTATGSSIPGEYPINLSGLTAVNYAITYVDGILQVLGSNQAVNQTTSAGSDQSLINNNTSVNTILVLAPGSGNDGSTFGMSEDNGQGYGHGSTFSRAEGQIVTTSSGIAVIYGDVHFGHLSQDLSQQVQNYLNGDTQAALSQWLTLGE